MNLADDLHGLPQEIVGDVIRRRLEDGDLAVWVLQCDFECR
jgi:hypothetical protein